MNPAILLEAGVVLLPKIAELMDQWLNSDGDVEELKAQTKAALEELRFLNKNITEAMEQRDKETQAAIDAAREE